jgi:TolB-like protein/Flp pilus assembly protein TadD
MRRCPKCRRDYYDDSLAYCLDDGAVLVDGPAGNTDPTTAILTEAIPPSEAATRLQVDQAERDARPDSREELNETSFPRNRALMPLLIVIGAAAVLTASFLGYRYFNAASGDQISSIAVLPFVNDSQNPDLEYLSDGMTETLIGSLSNLPNLNVKSRNSVFRYKGQETDVKKIGQDLGVQAVLTGRVRQYADLLTLDLELVDANTDNVIWSDRYQRTPADIVQLQTEIARDVSGKLRDKLSGAEQTRVTKSYTKDPEAYQLYLQGRFNWNKRTEAGTRKALELFQEAVDKDSRFALAYVGISDAYLLLGIPDAMSGVLPPKESVPKARAAADKALEIDDSLAEGYASRAHARWKARDWAGAEADFKHSIELNDNYVYSHLFYAHYLSMVGRADEGIAEARKAQQLDPLSIPVVANIAFFYYMDHRYDDALQAAKKAIDLDPGAPLAHQRLGLTYELNGQLNQAIPEFRTAVDQSDRAQTAVASLARALALSGDRQGAERLIDELKSRARDQYISSYNIALIYAALGDREQTFDYLEKAYDEESIDLLLAKVDPRLDQFRGEADFQKLLVKIGFP